MANIHINCISPAEIFVVMLFSKEVHFFPKITLWCKKTSQVNLVTLLFCQDVGQPDARSLAFSDGILWKAGDWNSSWILFAKVQMTETLCDVHREHIACYSLNIYHISTPIHQQVSQRCYHPFFLALSSSSWT